MFTEQILFAASIFIFVCLISSRAGRRLGVPTLLLFIVLGMICGSDGLLKIAFDDYVLTERICSVALLFIIFYGGFCTRWSEAKPVASRALVLSSLGTVLTAVFTALFCCLALHMSFLEGLLLGSVLGSTDAASVFFILRSRKLGLKDRSASLLEMESGSNDPFAYMMTAAVLAAMGGRADGKFVITMLLSQLVIGAACGVLTGRLSSWIMKRTHGWSDGSCEIFVLGMAMLAFALPEMLGGNGYLSAYIAGIILGNQELDCKKSLVGFFDGVTGIMQMVLFFLLGLLSFPSMIVPLIIPSLFLALFLTFIARPLAVGILLAPFRATWGQYAVVSWAGLRGAASIVFAIMAMNSGSVQSMDIFHMVFSVVLLSILFQGSLLPAVARLFRMTDDESDVMKTFSDYTEEKQIEFIPVRVNAEHPWCGRRIQDIDMLPDMIIAFIERKGETAVPRGSTVLNDGDTAYLCTEGLVDVPDVRLVEIEIDNSHRWCGKRLGEIKIPDTSLVIMVRRRSRVIIPDGETKLVAGDVIVQWSRKN